MSSSFKSSKEASVPAIQGTKLSLRNAQLLTSTGIPSLDFFLGGGLAVGTILLIDEDDQGVFANLLTKYFLSESVIVGHSLFIASLDQDAESLVRTSPGLVEHAKEQPHKKNSDPMKIAWRYENVNKVQSPNTMSNKFGHNYDLATTLSSNHIESSDIKHWAGEILAHNYKYLTCPLLGSLLRMICDTIQKGSFLVQDRADKRNILKIAIPKFLSPLWGNALVSWTGNPTFDSALITTFLMGLKSLVRSSLCVAMLTVPTNLSQNPVLQSRLNSICDTVIKLESFATSDKNANPLYKDYQGLLKIIKLPILSSLKAPYPDNCELAFKLKRRNFTVEKLHLPPDLSETASRVSGDSHGCGGSSNKLDF